MTAHTVTDVYWADDTNGGRTYHLRCACGDTWERPRLADAAVAHERHTYQMTGHAHQMGHIQETAA